MFSIILRVYYEFLYYIFNSFLFITKSINIYFNLLNNIHLQDGET